MPAAGLAAARPLHCCAMSAPDEPSPQGDCAPTQPSTRADPGDGQPELMDPAPLRDGRFVDAGRVGEGGMGVVDAAYDRLLGRTVALKAIRPSLVDKKGVRPAFLAEARLMAELEHPAIVPVYDVGLREDGPPCCAMKLIRGRTLADRIGEAHRERTIPLETYASLLGAILKVCEALAFAHSKGVFHCDVKPANVIVGEYGEVYLLDWGVAQRAGVPPRKGVGTFAYMSPEQALGTGVDARSDVFGVGATIYELLADHAPYPARSSEEAIAMAEECRITPPECPDAPPGLADLCLKALAKDPGDRYQSADELRAELEAFLLGTRHHEVARFPAGGLICREGESADCAYVVVSGECEVYRERDGIEHPLRRIGPGGTFGEIAVFTGSPRTASVRASTEVVVQVVKRSAFDASAGLNSWVFDFVRTLADRFVARDDEVLTLRSEQASAEIAVRALAALASHGTAEGTPYSALCASLAAGSPRSAADVAAVLERRDELAIDAAADRIAVRREP